MAWNFRLQIFTAFCILPSFVHCFLASDCFSKTDCISCVTSKSWIGKSCRWCPNDQKCHEYGSFRQNCSILDEKIQPEQCQRRILPQYDESLAYKFFRLANAAYCHKPQVCLNDSADFHVVATSVSKCDVIHDDCFGYVAVSKKQRAILLSFRGSVSNLQVMIEVLKFLSIPDKRYPGGGYVMSYFYDGFLKIWPKLFRSLTNLHKLYSDYEFWVTGHSLGGALASIGSIELVRTGLIRSDKIKFMSFGQPRTGDYWFSLAHYNHVPYSWRVVHHKDIVPHIPPCARTWNLCVPFWRFPYHHGTEVWYPEKDMEPNTGKKKIICTGRPFNEQKNCSNALSPRYNVDDHVSYFNEPPF